MVAAMSTRNMARQLHRWVGLAMAVFLVIAGLSGSLLAFYSELDSVINPALYPMVDTTRPALSMAELAAHASTLAPGTTVTDVYLREPERAEVSVAGADAFDTLLLNPVSGAELARYRWGDIAQGRVNLMPFIYRLHYELALSGPGIWIMGIVALLWTVDCFVGFYLTLPARKKSSSRKSWWQRWQPSWRISYKARFKRFNFDLHRATGLWLWAVLLMFAWSSVYMNLYDTVYTWTTQAVLDYRPSWTAITPPATPSITPPMSWQSAQERAEFLLRQQAEKNNVTVIAPVSLRYKASSDAFVYKVRTDRDMQTRRGVTELTFDAHSGALRLFLLPKGQYSGNTVSNWLYALHMGNVFGMPWRIFVCVLGVLLAVLSISGILVWLHKTLRPTKSLRHTG
jgi:uncharacterized iron-regulated membrane protein